MHPAYSVILFTTASGAGYGLLIWLALFGALNAVPITSAIGIGGFAISFALISIGLLSSTLHLGRPERAWRAMSQWRSSWLSREGIAALATYVPAGLLAFIWIVNLDLGGAGRNLAPATIILALVTVYCTGMIYASLPTIRQWHNAFVTPVYLILALATGAAWANALFTIADVQPPWLPLLTTALLALATVLKLLYWNSIDSERRTYTIEAATGLGFLGKVRPLEPAHTQPNFVMREMGYKVARTHALKLRRLVAVFSFAVPAVLLLLPPFPSPIVPVMASLLAVVSVMFGVFMERWLFFAEAEHVVTLYYGAERA